MGHWEILTAPLAILVLLALYRFVGCSFHTGGIPMPPSYQSSVTDYVASWRLGEGPATGDGSIANDETGNHPGTYTNTAGNPAVSPDSAPLPTVPLGGGAFVAPPGGFKAGVDGIIEKGSSSCERFNGGYVRVSNPDPAVQGQLNPAGDFSLVAWVWPESSWGPGDKTYRSVITSRSDDGVHKRGYVLYAGPNPDNAADTKYYWQAWVGGGGAAWQHVLGQEVRFDRPAGLIVTYSQASQQLTLVYADSGVNVDALPTFTNSPVTYSPSDPALNRPLFIGAGRTDRHDAQEGPPVQAPNYWFLGLLQELRIYARVLTTDEIQTLFTMGALS